MYMDDAMVDKNLYSLLTPDLSYSFEIVDVIGFEFDVLALHRKHSAVGCCVLHHTPNKRVHFLLAHRTSPFLGKTLQTKSMTDTFDQA